MVESGVGQSHVVAYKTECSSFGVTVGTYSAVVYTCDVVYDTVTTVPVDCTTVVTGIVVVECGVVQFTVETGYEECTTVFVSMVFSE